LSKEMGSNIRREGKSHGFILFDRTKRSSMDERTRSQGTKSKGDQESNFHEKEEDCHTGRIGGHGNFPYISVGKREGPKARFKPGEKRGNRKKRKNSQRRRARKNN